MHRTQIYFEEDLFEAVKRKAQQMGLSLSAYIRTVLKKELDQEEHNNIDFSEFQGLWKDRDITAEKLREEAWKR